MLNIEDSFVSWRLWSFSFLLKSDILSLLASEDVRRVELSSAVVTRRENRPDFSSSRRLRRSFSVTTSERQNFCTSAAADLVLRGGGERLRLIVAVKCRSAAGGGMYSCRRSSGGEPLSPRPPFMSPLWRFLKWKLEKKKGGKGFCLCSQPELEMTSFWRSWRLKLFHLSDGFIGRLELRRKKFPLSRRRPEHDGLA